jgi:hypothetical protein
MRIKIESEFLPAPLINCEPYGREQLSLIHNIVWIDTFPVIISDLNE